MKYDLDKIYIRAKVKGEYGSYSLEQLIVQNEPQQILHWVFDKIVGIAGLHPQEEIKRGHVIRLLKLLEKNGITIIKLK